MKPSVKSKKRNNLAVSGTAVSNTDHDNTPTYSTHVLPVFPSSQRPLRSGKRSSSSVGTNSRITEDVEMVPCNTILLQTTVDGKAQVSRTQKERERDPDRLCLDRRGLSAFPILVGEAKLRLLSLQHNLLAKLERMAFICLPHLVFLDIYNNQIECMGPLDGLRHLRVLLLGKNRIKAIEGLSNMSRLEVLDLHGNQIIQIGGLKNQRELKVLNLAGNEIRCIGLKDMEGLVALQELNLRRNQIKMLNGFEETPQISKLFLSNNDINSFEHLDNLRKLRQLKELSLDGNAVTDGGDCLLYVAAYVPSVLIFGQVKIAEESRKAAKIWRLRHEFHNRSSSLDVASKSRATDVKRARSASENRAVRVTRGSVKSPAKVVNRVPNTQPKLGSGAKFVKPNLTKQWTVSSESNSETGSEFRLPPILSQFTSVDEGPRGDPNTSMDSNKSYCSARYAESSESSTESSDSEEPIPIIAKRTVPEKIVRSTETPVVDRRTPAIEEMKTKPAKGVKNDKVKEQGGDYLVQISGRYLIVTGKNSAKHIDKPWNAERANDVATVKFNLVSFNALTPVFNRIKFRFPNVEHLIFSECELNQVGQLNALADVQGFTSLNISAENNSIVTKNWKSYAIYRLHHWGLRNIDDVQITNDEIQAAEEEYSGLSNIVLWSLPESLLTPLLSRLRLEIDSNLSAKQWLYRADPALRSVICKEALQWRSTSALSQNEISLRNKGNDTLRETVVIACNMILKLRKLEKEWKHIMNDMVLNILREYSNMDLYMKKKLQDLQPP